MGENIKQLSRTVRRECLIIIMDGQGVFRRVYVMDGHGGCDGQEVDGQGVFKRVDGQGVFRRVCVMDGHGQGAFRKVWMDMGLCIMDGHGDFRRVCIMDGHGCCVLWMDMGAVYYGWTWGLYIMDRHGACALWMDMKYSVLQCLK